jgi:16S rRNA processing protein RimM
MAPSKRNDANDPRDPQGAPESGSTAPSPPTRDDEPRPPAPSGADGDRSEWLIVGSIRKPHGIHGEVAAAALSDFPERLAPGVVVGIGGDRPERLIELHTVRWHKGAWLLGLVGVRERNDVEALRGSNIFLPAQPRADLPANYYYEHELIGCRCAGPAGEDLGLVTALFAGGGGTVLEVAAPRGPALVPFRSPIVVRVDPEARVIHLDPPRGLFDDDAL